LCSNVVSKWGAASTPAVVAMVISASAVAPATPTFALAEPEMPVGELASAALLGTTSQPCAASVGQCVETAIFSLL
jgi:hypothetical protein